MSDSLEWRQYMDKMFVQRSWYKSKAIAFGFAAAFFGVVPFQVWGSTTGPSQIVYTGAFAVGSAICFASMGYYYGRLVELDLRILDSGDDLAKRQLLSERVTDSKQNSQYWLLLAAIFVLGGVAVLLVSTGQQTARISLTMVLFAGAIGSMFGWYHETVKGAKAVKELGAA